MITAVKRLMMVTAAEGIAAVLPENPYAWEFVLHLLMFIMFSRHLLRERCKKKIEKKPNKC